MQRLEVETTRERAWNEVKEVQEAPAPPPPGPHLVDMLANMCNSRYSFSLVDTWPIPYQYFTDSLPIPYPYWVDAGRLLVDTPSHLSSLYLPLLRCSLIQFDPSEMGFLNH